MFVRNKTGKNPIPDSGVVYVVYQSDDKINWLDYSFHRTSDIALKYVKKFQLRDHEDQSTFHYIVEAHLLEE